MTRFTGKTVEIHNYPGQGVLGLPLCVYPSAIFYNADIFDAAGVDYPPAHWGEPYADGDPWTYDKLFEIARLLTLDANGNNANSPAFDPKNIVQYGWSGWDWANIGDFTVHFGDEPGTGVSLDGRTAMLTSPQWVTAFTYLRDNIWVDHIQANGEQAEAFYENAGEPMGSGMVGMWEVESWIGTFFPEWSARFTWDIAAVPADPGGRLITMVDADTAVIPQASNHKEQAWEVMKWLFEPERYNRLVNSYACLPADSVAMASWVDEQRGLYPGVNFEALVEALDYVEVVNHESWKPNYNAVNDVIEAAKWQIISGESLDVEALLHAANQEVQLLLDEYWAANP